MHRTFFVAGRNQPNDARSCHTERRVKVIPLVIVAVVVSFVLSKWLAGPPTAPQVPEPAQAAVPPQVR